MFLLLFKPTSDVPYATQDYYASTMAELNQRMAERPVASGDTLFAGWAKQNITPRQPTKLMGYGWKGNFEGVHDSLGVRSVVFRQDGLSVVLINYDLMLTPPTVARRVQAILTTQGLPHVYFTAGHTHHGFGEWQSGPAGTFITGGYNNALVDRLVEQTVASVVAAQRQQKPTQVSYAQYDQSNLVSNRLVRGGPVDPYWRVIQLRQSTGERAIISTFAAHATFRSSKSKELSADYPGAVVRQLEARPDVDFALFAAGAVGSHSPVGKGEIDLATYARRLVAPLTASEDTLSIHPMSFAEIPIELGEPQLRLFTGWQVRPWLFRWFFGDITPTLTVFRLGNILLIGTPTDFSGMLYSDVQSRGLAVTITSFNGEYIGYVIPDAYYSLPHREARENNWYGPHTGSYLTELINRITERIGRDSSATVSHSPE